MYCEIGDLIGKYDSSGNLCDMGTVYDRTSKIRPAYQKWSSSTTSATTIHYDFYYEYKIDFSKDPGIYTEQQLDNRIIFMKLNGDKTNGQES